MVLELPSITIVGLDIIALDLAIYSTSIVELIDLSLCGCTYLHYGLTQEKTLRGIARDHKEAPDCFREREAKMPLITKVLPMREDVEGFQDSVQVEQHPNSGKEGKENKDSGYEDFEEFGGAEAFEDSDMEGSVLHRPRPKKPVKAPALPQRSDKRASKMLENVMLELKNLDVSKSKEGDQQSILEDPHELYLSSEEDASLSDDYEDSLIEFDTTGTNETERATSSSSTASSRKPQEVTARVVSFTLVSKPQIIDIYIPSPSQKRHSLALSQTTSTQSKPTPRRPSPLKLYPSSIRRMSISSVASISTHNSSAPTAASREEFPSRKSRNFASNLTNLVTGTKSSLQSLAQHNHSFLNSDPFPAQEANEDTQQDENGTPITPRTPTSMTAAAWKRGFNRTLSKARKTSMPKLNLAYTAGVVTSRNSSKFNLAAATASVADLGSVNNGREKEESEERKPIRRSVTMPIPPTTPHEGPLRYEDIMKNVIRAPPPPPLASPKERRSGGLGMMGLGRKKSVKGK